MGETTHRRKTRSIDQTHWHYVIGGAPRSGKSTLADGLQRETGGIIVRGDALMTAFTSTALESGIHGGTGEPYDSLFLSALVCRYARNLSRSETVPVIVEGIGLQPESIDRTQLRRAGFRTAFLGYPYISVDEKTALIRRYAQGNDQCWSHTVSDTRLRELVQAAIRDSLQTRLKCFKLGLPFYDTGKDFEATIATARDRLLMPASDDQSTVTG